MENPRASTHLAALALALGLPLAACNTAQQGQTAAAAPAPAPAPSVSSGPIAEQQTTTDQATVVAVDHKNRVATLKDRNGQPFTVQVGPEARNFDQVKVGDTVRLQYVEAIVLALKKPGEATVAASSGGGITRARPGELPAGTVQRYVTVTSEIVQVDPALNTITLRGPNGVSRTLNVKRPEYQKRLPELKPGDLIEATYSEAMMIAVERPK